MDLAVRGFLRIEETQSGTMFSRTDWRLVQLLRRWTKTRTPTRRRSDGLFSTGLMKLSELEVQVPHHLNLAIRQMYSEVVERGWFRRSPQRQRQGKVALGFLLIGAGVVSRFYLGVVTNAIDQTGKFGIGIPSGVVLGLGLIVAGLIFRILGKRMATRPPPVRRCTRRHSASASTPRPPRPARSGSRRRRRSSAGTSCTRSCSVSPTGGPERSRRRPRPPRRRGARWSCRPGLYSGAMFPDFSSIADGAGGSFASSAGGTFAATASPVCRGGVGVRWGRLQRRRRRRRFELGLLVGGEALGSACTHAVVAQSYTRSNHRERRGPRLVRALPTGRGPHRSAGRPRSRTTSRPWCARPTNGPTAATTLHARNTGGL